MSDPSSATVGISIAVYSLCSGSMLLVNKLTLHWLPFASSVTLMQVIATTAFVYGAKHSGMLKVDELDWAKVKPYMIYVAAFTLGIMANMKALVVSNVETIIVFRACTPLAVSVLDAMYLGREWPTRRSWFALVLICVGAAGYVNADKEFHNQGMMAYFWPIIYFFIISFEMTYGKKVASGVALNTLSGPVLYTNLLSIVPMIFLATVSNEPSAVLHMASEPQGFPVYGLTLLLLSCIIGTAISYAGWWCRSMVSATTYTLVGVMNKFITIIGNVLVWDQHATPLGIFCLLICILGGTIYRQAPMRETQTKYSRICSDL